MNKQPEWGLHEELMAAYLAKRANLVRFLAARLGSKVQAEDAVQDLFLKLAAIDAGAKFENPEAMIYRMAANLAIDQLRSGRRAKLRDQSWLHLAPTEEPSVEQAWAARQRMATLMQAVDQLPPRMRQAFRLCKIEERTREEAAQQMGVSVKAVEKQITAALKVLTWRTK